MGLLPMLAAPFLWFEIICEETSGLKLCKLLILIVIASAYLKNSNKKTAIGNVLMAAQQHVENLQMIKRNNMTTSNISWVVSSGALD